jgi:hypothetical protein
MDVELAAAPGGKRRTDLIFGMYAEDRTRQCDTNNPL